MRFEKLRLRSDYRDVDMELAPLVDVVFNLLLFFMLTSSFVLQPGVKVKLPQAVTSEVIGMEHLAVILSSHDLIFVNGKPISIPQLDELLKETARGNKSILIKADADASLGRLVEIWDLCRRDGIAQVNIATNQR